MPNEESYDIFRINDNFVFLIFLQIKHFAQQRVFGQLKVGMDRRPLREQKFHSFVIYR